MKIRVRSDLITIQSSAQNLLGTWESSRTLTYSARLPKPGSAGRGSPRPLT
ncbi:MAG TPA: hypothetical protein VGI05_01680 [Streptosporangiaceae bacterium]|jgi:hypothetical protein